MLRRPLPALLSFLLLALTACAAGQPSGAPKPADPPVAQQPAPANGSAATTQTAPAGKPAAAPPAEGVTPGTAAATTGTQPAASPEQKGSQPTAEAVGTNPAPANPAPVVQTRLSTVYPLTIRDHDGNTVVIEKKPERVITFAPSNTELVFGVGAGASVVGVDTYSEWPSPAVDKIAKVGDLFSFALEKIVALKPDVIFTAPSKDVVPKMKEAGLKVVVTDAATVDEVYANIQLVGLVLDLQDQAAAVAADMKARIAAVEAKVKGAREKPNVFYEVWYDPLTTAGPGSFIHDIIGRAGGKNIAAATGQAYPTVSLEAMVAADPRVIITTDPQWAKDVMNGKYPGWLPTTAMMTSHIYVVPEAILDHPSQRLVDGVEALAKLIHPELYGGSR